MTFPGRHGSVIYLQSYLSTMFQISDVMIDKEEVAMILNIKLELPEKDDSTDDNILEHEICVSDDLTCVSKHHIEIVIQKMAKILFVQGISCFECPNSRYKLYPLSDDCTGEYYIRARKEYGCRFGLAILCGDRPARTFELTLSPCEKNKGEFDYGKE